MDVCPPVDGPVRSQRGGVPAVTSGGSVELFMIAFILIAMIGSIVGSLYLLKFLLEYTFES